MINTTIQVGTAQLLNASATAVTTATPLNITSIYLNPGVWEISGIVTFTPAASTSVTRLQAGIGTATATLPSIDNGLVNFSTAANVLVNPFSIVLPPLFVTIAGTAGATIYLVASATFTVSTLTASGFLTIEEMQR